MTPITIRDRIDKLAVCMHGRIGIVQGKLDGVWYGIHLFGGGKWQSREPRFIRQSDSEAVLLKADNLPPQPSR